jgi:Ni,Fe-hydrogenase I cytochrome b subunit
MQLDEARLQFVDATSALQRHQFIRKTVNIAMQRINRMRFFIALKKRPATMIQPLAEAAMVNILLGRGVMLSGQVLNHCRSPGPMFYRSKKHL